jgi:DNA modification methylase
LSQKNQEKLERLMKEKGISKKQAALELGIGHRPNLSEDGRQNLSNSEGGARVSSGIYVAPAIANPGNVIDCGTVGGGHLGSNISHESEAPFDEDVPRFFIKSFCPPGGIVCDPFGGSGTTLAQAIKCGRKFISIDIRQSQIDLMLRRIRQADLNKGLILDI